MQSKIFFEKQQVSSVANDENVYDLKTRISQQYHVSPSDLFVTVNGKLADNDFNITLCCEVIRVQCKLIGGKGGFGSMLRAIGAQIEKTTNREACRDLSGRRLRDINEEKRLRKWLDGQADREKEAVERKQKKLERLVAEPKIQVKLNPEYEKEREALPERVSAAIDAGWEAAGASSASSGLKRKAPEAKKETKKSKLWIDAELSDCSSGSEEDENTDEKAITRPIVSTDSGNESDKVSESSKT